MKQTRQTRSTASASENNACLGEKRLPTFTLQDMTFTRITDGATVFIEIIHHIDGSGNVVGTVCSQSSTSLYL